MFTPSAFQRKATSIKSLGLHRMDICIGRVVAGHHLTSSFSYSHHLISQSMNLHWGQFAIILFFCHGLVHIFSFLVLDTQSRTQRVFPHKTLSLSLKKPKEGMIPLTVIVLARGQVLLGDRSGNNTEKGGRVAWNEWRAIGEPEPVWWKEISQK